VRGAIAILICAGSAAAQFRSTVLLVLAPVTVTDSRGHYVDGLTADDLILLDNNVPQAIQLDWTTFPIDLVVAVQTSANSGPALDKLGGSGILFSQLLAAQTGETAVLSFSDEVKRHQDFTGNADLLIRALRTMRKEGGNAHMLDALREAVGMLEARPARRRRIVFMIAEKRDRGSSSRLPDVMAQVQRSNVTVYWASYSPFLQPFTTKPDDSGTPYDPGPGGYLYAIGELARLSKPNLSELFAKVTGGRTLGFLKKNTLEEAIQRVGQEVHRQYILSFQPALGGKDSGGFHSIPCGGERPPGGAGKNARGILGAALNEHLFVLGDMVHRRTLADRVAHEGGLDASRDRAGLTDRPANCRFEIFTGLLDVGDRRVDRGVYTRHLRLGAVGDIAPDLGEPVRLGFGNV